MNSPATDWINSRIDDALQKAFEKIDAYQRDGYCTEQDVEEVLLTWCGSDMLDAWREYIGSDGG